jgi:hypothetical protein
MTFVIDVKDGRLFCFDCGEFISNTANFEMKKEGVFAHSHSCQKNNNIREKLKNKLKEE